MKTRTIHFLIFTIIGCFSSIQNAQSFSSNNDWDKIKSHTDSLVALNEPQLAIDYLKSLISQAPLDTKNELKAKLSHEIHSLFLQPELSLVDSAIYYLNKEIDLISDNSLLYLRYMKLGKIYGQYSQFYEAEAPYLEALKRINFAPSKKDEIQTYIYVGLVYAKLGQLEKGIPYIEQAIAIGSKTNDKELEYKALYGKAFYHSITREYEKDLALFPRLLDLSYQLEDSAQIYQTLLLGVSIYDALEIRDTAEIYILTAQTYNLNQSPFQHYDLLATLASIQLKNKNVDEAKKNATEALEGLKKYNWEETETGGFAHEVLADIEVLSNNYLAAIKHFQFALNSAKEEGRKHKEKEILWGLIDAYREQGSHKIAISHVDKYIALSDSLSKDLYKLVSWKNNKTK